MRTEVKLAGRPTRPMLHQTQTNGNVTIWGLGSITDVTFRLLVETRRRRDSAITNRDVLYASGHPSAKDKEQRKCTRQPRSCL